MHGCAPPCHPPEQVDDLVDTARSPATSPAQYLAGRARRPSEWPGLAPTAPKRLWRSMHRPEGGLQLSEDLAEAHRLTASTKSANDKAPTAELN